MRQKLTARSSVPTVSGTDSATWNATNESRSRDGAVPSRTRPGTSVRRDVRRIAGATPSTSATAAQVRTVSTVRRPSSATSVAASGGRNVRRTRTPSVRTSTKEPAPAAADSRTACKNTSRSRRPRPAPSAALSVSSDVRRRPVRTSRLATLPQAMSSTRTETAATAISTCVCCELAGACPGGSGPNRRRASLFEACRPVNALRHVEDLRRACLRATGIDPGLEAHQRSQAEVVVAGAPLLVPPPALERHPDIDRIVVDAGETARPDRHDRMRALPESHGPTDDVGRATEALLPKRVADDDGLEVRRPAGTGQHADGRRDAQDVEVRLAESDGLKAGRRRGHDPSRSVRARRWPAPRSR